MRISYLKSHLVAAAIVSAFVLMLAGCQEEAVVPNTADRVVSVVADRELLDQVFSNLNRMSELGPREVKSQVVDRLNQWARSGSEPLAWTPDPMLAALSPQFRKWGVVKNIESDKFVTEDAEFLFEAVLLRDTARFICKDVFDKVEMARRLFEWTVDNIALDNAIMNQNQVVAKSPWQTLVYGRGNYNDRAWLFILLARQQNLDVVHITVPLKAGIHEWCALVVQSNETQQDAISELYLFDHIYGLPVSGKEPGSIATLKQVAEDENLLRRFDADGQPYPVQSKHLKKVFVAIEASPGYLSQRMKRVELQLSGNKRVVLTSRPIEMFDRLEIHPQIEKVGLWVWPYLAGTALENPKSLSYGIARAEMQPFEFCLISEREHIVQAALENNQLVPFTDPDKFRERLLYPLWCGRLKQVTGQLNQQDEQEHDDGEQSRRDVASAKSLYQKARAFQFSQYYDTSDWRGPQLEYARLYEKVSQDAATYWLGVVSNRGARFYLQEIVAGEPKHRWRAAAQFQLARIHERLGETEKAIEIYKSIPGAAARGCKIRAQRLMEQLGGVADGKPSDEDGESEPQPADESKPPE
jgi:hypothetical protein